MSSRGHGKEAHGGKPVGRRVPLPRGAREPIKVHVNGMEQTRGEDYMLHEGEIVFKDPILKEDLSELPFMRKLVLGLGLVGSYQKNETVDVEYMLDGRQQLASDLDVVADRH
jgi:hypothetical protein